MSNILKHKYLTKNKKQQKMTDFTTLNNNFMKNRAKKNMKA